MYHIVSFVDTDEVEVVPAIWVKKDVCVWPPYKGKGIQRATKYLEQPHESWSAYKVKILYTAKNYSEARRKLPLAEQQTDLQSEAESDSLRPPKRKIKRNRRLMDEYDTEEEEATAPIKNNLPQAPQIHPLSNRICSASNELQPSPQGQRQNHPSVSHQKSPDVAQIPETSRPSLLEISPASERHERTLGPALRQAIDLPEPSLLLHQTSQQPWQVRNFARKSQDITEHHSELMWQQDTPLQSPGQEMQSLWHHETPRPQRKSLSSDDRLIRSLLHDIVSKQEILMEQQRNIIRMVQDIKANNVQEITETQNQSPKQFPIEDLRSLTSLESDLRSCPVTRQKVVLELGLLGGVDVKDTVWRIMRQAIKNDFAKVVNWRGVHGKTPFQSLQLKNIVIEAVRRNPVCAQTTELEVEKVIKRWFHLAGDREGGRKRRTPLQNVNVNHTF